MGGNSIEVWYGKVWLDENGLPVRQEVFLSMPGTSEMYDAEADMVVDFRFDASAIQEQAARLEGRCILNTAAAVADNVAPTDPKIATTTDSTMGWREPASLSMVELGPVIPSIPKPTETG